MSRENVIDLARFPSTQWSLVGRAGHISDERRREALSTLLRRYMPALRAHLVLTRRISPDQADDLIQGFIADKIIEQNLLAQAEASRGRFRSFLLAALNHHVISQFRHDTARKRSPTAPLLDIADQSQISAGAEPSLQFMLEWARQVVAEARRRMEAHCKKTNRMDLWLAFVQLLLRPVHYNAAAQAQRVIAKELKLSSAKQVSNLLITAKRLFKGNLRGVVGEYSSSEREIDEEIDDLMRILSQHS